MANEVRRIEILFASEQQMAEALTILFNLDQHSGQDSYTEGIARQYLSRSEFHDAVYHPAQNDVFGTREPRHDWDVRLGRAVAAAAWQK